MSETSIPYIPACPVGCAGALAETGIVMPEGALLRCPECRQLVSQVSEARYWQTMRAFDEPDFNQPSGRESARRSAVARRRLRRIATLVRKPPGETKLLDVGCSRGHFVATAVAMGFHAEGVEPAPAIAEAARKAGLKVRTGLLDDARYPDCTFDAVTLFEVLEHLKDPLALMRECRRIMKPGSILCASTGNTASWTVAAMGARWDYFQMDKDAGHVSFYNPRSIEMLARRSGYTPVEVHTSRVRLTEKADVSRPVHALGKAVAEMLNLPARLAGRGHDLLAFLRRD